MSSNKVFQFLLLSLSSPTHLSCRVTGATATLGVALPPSSPPKEKPHPRGSRSESTRAGRPGWSCNPLSLRKPGQNSGSQTKRAFNNGFLKERKYFRRFHELLIVFLKVLLRVSELERKRYRLQAKAFVPVPRRGGVLAPRRERPRPRGPQGAKVAPACADFVLHTHLATPPLGSTNRMMTCMWRIGQSFR